MTGLFGIICVCIFGFLIFLIAVGWREDRENRRERLTDPNRGQNVLAEWDPLADLLEDEGRRRKDSTLS